MAVGLCGLGGCGLPGLPHLGVRGRERGVVGLQLLGAELRLLRPPLKTFQLLLPRHRLLLPLLEQSLLLAGELRQTFQLLVGGLLSQRALLGAALQALHLGGVAPALLLKLDLHLLNASLRTCYLLLHFYLGPGCHLLGQLDALGRFLLGATHALLQTSLLLPLQQLQMLGLCLLRFSRRCSRGGCSGHRRRCRRCLLLGLR
mmetsp:Transcript_96039/g.311561  ORF Transcript_96039/g.311561 Transcript_96039/m.311561 type:complete len:202 (+) Transcript_96039:931-1536(+)